jgi:patatin-like phospholipase
MIETALAWVHYAVLLRVPVLVGLMLVALPVLATATGARAMLAGLFDVSPTRFYFVTLAAVATAWTVMMTSYVILSFAHLRMHFGRLHFEPAGSPLQWVFPFALLALPTLVAVLYQSRRRGLARLVAAALLGVGTMALMFLAGRFLHLRVAPPDGASVAVPAAVLGRLQRSGLFAGYVDARGLRPEHLATAIAFGLSLLLYAILGWISRRRLGGSTVPALTFILLLLMLLGWGLSGLSFFFDAPGVPLLLVLAVWVAAIAQSSASDHYYHVLDGADGPSPTPAEAILAAGGDTAVVVAANGGGIQAAVWTARVLTGLVAECRAEFGDDRFLRAVRCVSAVSGGGVGAMYFVDACGRGMGEAALAKVLRDAADSRLDEVAWGLVYPDLRRHVFPWSVGRLAGRGRALEEAWKEAGTGVAAPLASWCRGARDGTRPAVIFNATLAETGSRLLFATAPLDPCSGMKDSHAARLNFEELYPGKDVAVVTAVRLSATFPYVSPAARADLAGRQPHVVDGGYFDNYGMTTLVEWLDAALQGARGKIRRVLVLQLRGAPVVRATPAAARRVASRGWFYQAFAPIATMLSVRNAAQISNDEVEYDLLQRAWAGEVDLHSVVFEFPGEHPPLSWHLTAEQKEAIETHWTRSMVACRRAVLDFLRGPAAGD